MTSNKCNTRARGRINTQQHESTSFGLLDVQNSMFCTYNRPNRLTKCCTQFKPLGNETVCSKGWFSLATESES